ncbi:MAG: GNAT family N-acetyltransferase [Lachnospiraceae bacterium]|nr:GNAT family N-acetyltransferase [Lachnospiraceae bacterium]
MAYKCPTYGGSYFIYLDTLIVDEGARGKGIGRMMMEHLYKLACEQMIYEIKLMTTKDRPAYQIYKHLGFQDMDKYVYMNCWGW